MTDDVVLTEQRDHTLLVTINRPRSANSINAEVHERLGEAWERAEATASIRAVVLTGSGESTFCGGADLKALATVGPEGVTPAETAQWGFAGVVRHHISKPVICAVNGMALGGGTELALAGDIVVAADTAAFGLPEVRRGLIAGAGGAFRLISAIPRAIAMELLLTGNPLTAQDALRWGLVNRVVPPGEVVSTAITLAADIARGAPLAVQASKTVARGIVDGSVPAEELGWELTSKALARLQVSADTVEGLLAFVERRDPVWTGR